MKVKFEPLMDLSDQMARLQQDLQNESDEVTRVFQVLQQLSGMDGVLEGLRHCRNELEQEAWQAHQQSGTLAQVVRWYDIAERRIRDEYEDAAIRYPRIRNTVVDLSPIADYLK